MSKTRVALRPAKSHAGNALHDITVLALQLEDHARALMLHEFALRGLLTTAVKVNVPPAQVPEFVEPIAEGLADLYSTAHDLARRAFDVGRRLHRGVVRS